VADSSRLGKVLKGKYRLDEELGRGGMGAVYRAFHVLVHKEYAVKVLSAEVAEHESIAKRFLLEAQAAGRIGHPGILEVFDVGDDDDGRPFMVMELLRGEPLSALVARGPLPVDAACWIAIEVLKVLCAAHEAGVVHRDVKPQNVFLVLDGDKRRIKLLDFGIAKFRESDSTALTKSGEIIGSPLYMAPEQAKGESDVDQRADVWSVGAMLYEMLTGKPAHAATTAVAVLAKILTEEAQPPSSRGQSIPKTLDALVVRSLKIDRAARFETAKEMLAALREVRAELGTADTSPTFEPPPPRIVRTGADRDAEVGVATSTIASSPTRTATSVEPPLEAAVTKGDTQRSGSRPVLMVAALAAVAGAGAFLLFGRMETREPEHVPASAPPAASTLAPASAPASAPARATASASAAVPAASASTSFAAASSPAPAVSSASPSAPAAPALRCAASEIVSNGHCCPRGMAWQGGSCARPLATSF
jgi:serine/threonine-protein kinase